MRRFHVESGAIHYGLGAIKGLGARAADLIAEARQKGGPFSSLEELCERLDANVVNKTALEAMVQAGAFDEMGRSRMTTFGAIESALRSSAVAREDRRRGQRLLFGAPAAPQDEVIAATGEHADEWPEAERLQREKESLGFYLSGHPFEKRGAFLRRIAGHTTASAGSVAGGETVRIAGMVSAVRVLQIKQGKNAGQKMARFQLEDLNGSIAVTCFARAYQRHKDRIVDDAIVFLSARVDEKSEEKALLLEEIEPASEVVRREVAGIVLLLRGQYVSESTLERIAAICERHRGNQSLHLDVEEDGHVHRVRSDSGIHVTDALLDDFALAVGGENMSFARR